MTFFQEKCMTNSNNKKDFVQARLNERDRAKFDEIKSMIEFDRQQGIYRTPTHSYAQNYLKITDSDVLRYIIRNFNFKD
jgi:hypothetical protein